MRGCAFSVFGVFGSLLSDLWWNWRDRRAKKKAALRDAEYSPFDD